MPWGDFKDYMRTEWIKARKILQIIIDGDFSVDVIIETLITPLLKEIDKSIDHCTNEIDVCFYASLRKKLKNLSTSTTLNGKLYVEYPDHIFTKQLEQFLNGWEFVTK